MLEAAPHPQPTPEEYLAQLEAFLADTGRMASEQHHFLQWGGQVFGEAVEPLRHALQQTVAENLAAAADYISALGQTGVAVVVQTPEGPRPFSGLRLPPGQAHYSAKTLLDHNTSVWVPLDGNFSLSVL